ncbi:hypothetical protein NYO98_08075 [Nocardioides sp. STR2]|uniref:Uncharacterized protein n=1 Tax=Nocardioides pini TaxID=2975053 RepID=A0ABT4CB81_9ACTN|nr:hypothetical protein [Nocardioides pini]MCY4726231.1 hypothetical protein [Nocardioides pini]
MTKISSTMLSVGTLLRRAEDSGAEVSVLVTGSWLQGRVIGCDGMGAVLDDGDGQALVRLDAVTAVRFRRAQMEHPDGTVRSHGGTERGPIEAGPVTVPRPSRGEQPHEVLPGLSAAPR